MSREPESPVATVQYLDDAIRHLEQAVRLSPGNARYAALLGEAWLLHGDPEAALAPLQASIQQEVHPRVASLLALSLLKLDRFSDAENLATVALEETSVFHRAYFIRAEARVAMASRNGAMEDLRQAVELCPESEPYRLRLASLLVEGGVMGEGDRRELTEARALLDGIDDPREGAAWRYLRGCVLIELGEPGAALLALEDLAWPTACEVALRRGYAHLELGNRAEALAAFQQARVDPELTDMADRMIARVELGPDHEAPTVRAAPVTQMVTANDAATELLSSTDDPEETADEIAMLDDGSGDDGSGDDSDGAKPLHRVDPTEELERPDLDGGPEVVDGPRADGRGDDGGS